MFTVYILFSEIHQKTYVGYTSDLPNRVISHNILAIKGYTIKFRPWKVIHTEDFFCKSEALQREKFYKSGKGRMEVHNIVNSYKDLYPPLA